MNHQLIKFIILINITLLAGQFFLTSRRATDGAKLAQLESDYKTISEKNGSLKIQIFQHSSLSEIYLQAQKQSLAPSKVSFLSPLSVASAVNLPAVP